MRLSWILLATKSSSGPSKQSPWAPSEWKLRVNVGREEGTWMPREWAASGARLVFDLDVCVSSDPASGQNSEDEFLRSPMRLQVLEDPVFISTQGEQFIPTEEEGAWKISRPQGVKKGDASMLRFWIDLLENENFEDHVAAKRNDAVLPAERLYFVAKCWRAAELEMGLKRMSPIETAAEQAQRKVEEELSHATGDRRLDGTNMIDAALGTLDMAKLVAERDERFAALRSAEEVLPRTSENLAAGLWPGTTDPLSIAAGTVFLRRRKLLSDEFHLVGKWDAVPIDEGSRMKQAPN